MTKSFNWFDSNGFDYARYRPSYPVQLVAFLASCAPDHRLALDVGCGTGQLTIALAGVFQHVIGVDPSAEQIAHVEYHENIDYLCASAEQLCIEDRSVSLVTVAQAAHWFDLGRFYAEVRRISLRGGVLALISYGVPQLPPVLNRYFQHFYHEQIGPYWPAQRRLVDEGYTAIDFPFTELPVPEMAISLTWDLRAFLGYITTWSAARAAQEAGREDILVKFATDMATAWGDEKSKQTVLWPVNMRVGRL